MQDKLADALQYIRDSFIADAASAKKKRRPLWIGAAAAVLAIVILFNLGGRPMAIQATAISLASSPRVMSPPNHDDYASTEDWSADRKVYQSQQDAIDIVLTDAMPDLTTFFQQASREVLSGAETQNALWSPLNGYIALAMLAETTGGETRQQILDLLCTSDLDTLRTRVEAVWERTYRNDGKEISTLANSLWLDQDLSYNQETMDLLSHYHYASVYQGDFGSRETNQAIQAWLNNSTGGRLRDPISSIQLSPETVLALASTVYFQSKWGGLTAFSPANNTGGTFHSPTGDVRCTFMNKKLEQMNYYWGDSYGAVFQNLRYGAKMWLFLPDEGKTPADILSGSQYLDMIANTAAYEETNSKYMKVNLSLPKFDITASSDLKAALTNLGVTNVFDLETADFTAITGDTPVYLTAVNQSTRITVDEEGVTAASYFEMPGAGAAMPPEEIIDFILDRPFLFVIADRSGLPLFTGIVNCPT